jgi:hypothetical protein
VLTVEIGDGLPSNSRPGSIGMDMQRSVGHSNRFSPAKPSRKPNSPGNIATTNTYNTNYQGGNSMQSKQSLTTPTVPSQPFPQNQPQGMQKFIVPPRPSGQQNSPQTRVVSQIGQQVRPNLRPPPPPSEPAPPNQPTMPLGGFRLPSLAANPNFQLKKNAPRQPSAQQASTGNTGLTNQKNNPKLEEILRTPDAGVSGAKRNSLTNQKPMPGAGRPKPKPKPVVVLPKCTALYDYDAKDVDELTLKEGDTIEIVAESDSGWWSGRLRGKDGLFPANYVQKI